MKVSLEQVLRILRHDTAGLIFTKEQISDIEKDYLNKGYLSMIDFVEIRLPAKTYPLLKVDSEVVELRPKYLTLLNQERNQDVFTIKIPETGYNYLIKKEDRDQIVGAIQMNEVALDENLEWDEINNFIEFVNQKGDSSYYEFEKGYLTVSEENHLHALALLDKLAVKSSFSQWVQSKESM